MAKNINELRSEVWATEKNNHKLTWKDVCKMNAIELQNRLDKKVKGLTRPDLICDITEDGRLVLKKEVVNKQCKEFVDKMSDFEVKRIKEYIIENTPEESTPDLSYENICDIYRELNSRTIMGKREITSLRKICKCHVHENGGNFIFDMKYYIPMNQVTEITNLDDPSKGHCRFTDVMTPNSDLMITCNRLGINIITFDPEGFEQQELWKMYCQGLYEVREGKRFFPIGLSASKARVGGVVWMVNASDWMEVEKIRAEVLHVSFEEYVNMMKDPCVIAKFETGTIGMRTSAVIDVTKFGKETKGKVQECNVVKEDDIKTKARIPVAMRITTEGEGLKKAFNHKLLTDEIIELIPSDGMNLVSFKAHITSLNMAGIMSNNNYETLMTKWVESGYDISILKTDPWIVKLLNSKQWVPTVQGRRNGGIKGQFTVVAEMDSDPRLKGVDIIAFGKSVKYISNAAPYEIINYPHLNTATLNYQFCQSTVSAEDSDVLIKGAKRVLEDTKKVLTDPAYACKFMGAIRNINDGFNEEIDDQATKIANDLEVEPRVLNDVYHSVSIKERLDKYIRGISFGRIPVKGAYRYVISDPVYLYHKVVGDDFESSLKAGEVYVDGIDGYDCGMWRSPMIHFSEPQRAAVKNVDYLHIYKDLVILNPYDGIAPSLGGADFDGDKFLVVIDYKDGSFESDLVQAIQMPGYILMDDFSSAPKVDNTIENRIKYYIALSKKARVGQITNWATCVNDMMLNVQKGSKEYNWLNTVLMTLRSSQMAEIDSVKTGITADGPKGDLMPQEYCNPKKQPLWFVELKKWQGRPLSSVNIYHSNSPMQKLYNYVTSFYKTEIIEGFQPRGILEVVGQSLTEDEIIAFASIKDTVISYEAQYRQEMKQLITLKEKGCVDGDEASNSAFDNMKDRYRIALDSLIQGPVTANVVAYACYYAANTRANNGKISGKRSFPWFCYYAEMLDLLYRNNHSIMLIVLPDIEMEFVQIKDGTLLIDGNVIKTNIHYPNIVYGKNDDGSDKKVKDGIYGIKEIEGKPYLVIPRPKAPKVVKEISSEREFMFSVSRFMKENQGVNSEELIKRIHENGDIVDIVMDNLGNINMVINGDVYGAIKDCPLPLVNQNVRIRSHSELTFIPKAVRSTTVMKNDVEAYSQYITLNCVIVKTTDVKINVDVPVDGVYSNGNYDEDGYRLEEESWEQYL